MLAMRRPLALFVVATLATTALAHADGGFLSRLSPNVGAMEVERPRGADAVVGVRLDGLRGQEGRVTTFGQVFRKGDWPKGKALVADIGGTRLPVQTDVKARHPDGSVRHAILSLRNPGGSAAQLALRMADAAPGGDPLDIRSILPRGYNLTVVFDFGGRKVTLDTATLVKQAVTTDPARWLQGPLASEIRIERKLTPQLTAIFDIRALADGAVRTSVSMHNDSMTETNNLDIAYGYAIRMSGQTMVERKVTHRRYANWREIVWAGAEPSGAHVAYDYPYMIATGAVPAYDPELRIDRAYLDKWPKKLAESDIAPFGNALIQKAMPTTGGRGDLGLVPEWTLAWLRTQSPQHRYAMMQTAEAAGAVPWHLRDPATKMAPTLDAHPKFWMDYRATEGANGHGPIKTKVDGWKIDNAHQPDLTYVPYLISGDRHFLDELHAQVAAGLFAYNPRPGYRNGAVGSLSNEEVRGQAWVNRTHGYAAWITPDAHPLKRYLDSKLRSRLAWYAREYPEDDDLGGPARYETAGWIKGANPKGVISNWQQDFFTSALGQSARMGFAESGAVFGYMRPYLLNRFLRADFNPMWSTGYKTLYGDTSTGKPHATWREVAQANIRDGRYEARPASQTGDHDKAWNFAAQGRAGYASLVGSFADPLMAEAYATLVRNTTAMHRGKDGFGAHPKWGIVPVFPDGTTLALADHRAVDGRVQGGERNELFAGGPQSDTLLGGGGNDIVAGLDGDDTVAGGGGFNLLSGGRGDDRIVAEGGITVAAGGPGADTFYTGRLATGGPAPVGRLEIVDFRPGTDRLAFPPSLGDPAAVLRGARADKAGTLIPLGKGGGSILLRGVRPGDVRADSLAMR